jgi:hypothetical protein
MSWCPCCDNQMEAPYLHHGAVTVYNRHEHAEHLVLTQISSGQSTIQIVPSQWSGNPSVLVVTESRSNSLARIAALYPS